MTVSVREHLIENTKARNAFHEAGFTEHNNFANLTGTIR